MIRPAETKDIPEILELLKQVNQIHVDGRPDIFVLNTKFDRQALEEQLADPNKVIFVYDDAEEEGPGVEGTKFDAGGTKSAAEGTKGDAEETKADAGGGILGYAFTEIKSNRDNAVLKDIRTLYIEDICVDEGARGRHVGRELYQAVENYAKENSCYNITLNVWEFNTGAKEFYAAMGLLPMHTIMEKIL